MAQGIKFRPLDLEIFTVDRSTLSHRTRYRKLGLVHINGVTTEINVSLNGSVVVIEDASALGEFFTRLLSQDWVTLRLRGNLTVQPSSNPARPFLRTSHEFDKEIRIQGLAGPACSVSAVGIVAEPHCWAIHNYFGDDQENKVPIFVTMHIVNPGPVILEVGRCYFAICDDDRRSRLPGFGSTGRKFFGLFEGKMALRAHEFEIELEGWVDTSVVLGAGKAKLKGMSCLPSKPVPPEGPKTQPDWCQGVISALETKIDRMDRVYAKVGMPEAEAAEKSTGNWRRWNHRLWGDRCQKRAGKGGSGMNNGEGKTQGNSQGR